MKFNYQIIIEYLGANFVGWQFQKNGSSIQANIEKALSKTLRTKIKIIGSGRTDAGVNAWGQSANFYVKNQIKNSFKFLSTVNFFLQKSRISVLDIKKKSLDFHARHSAKKRQYEYIILNRIAKPSIEYNRSWLVKKKLDLQKMKKGISYFIGTHNFTTFRASSCSAKSPVRTINLANVVRKKDKIIFKFESKSFLQKQIRSMVGCLKYIGEKRWKPEKIKQLIRSKNRQCCAPPAPPQGLFLKKIFY